MKRPDIRDSTYPKLTMAEVKIRLQEARKGHYAAASIAEIIWPGRIFRTQQGAAAAACRMLKAVGIEREFKGYPLPLPK